jgi:hypothetical protein
MSAAAEGQTRSEIMRAFAPNSPFVGHRYG